MGTCLRFWLFEFVKLFVFNPAKISRTDIATTFNIAQQSGNSTVCQNKDVTPV